MNVLSFFILSGQGLGAVIFGKYRYKYIEFDTDGDETGWVELSLGFRWIAWSAYEFLWAYTLSVLTIKQVNMIIGGVITIVVYFLLVETRGSKILEDRARQLTSQTGVLHIADTYGSNKEQRSMFELIKMTTSRPIAFLLTEPVVSAIAIWAALLSVHILPTFTRILIRSPRIQMGHSLSAVFCCASCLPAIWVFCWPNRNCHEHRYRWCVFWDVRGDITRPSIPSRCEAYATWESTTRE